MPFNPSERYVSDQPWVRLQEARHAKSSPKDFMAKLDANQRKQLSSVTCPLQSARLRALLLRMEILQGYRTELTGAESADQVRSIVAAAKDRGRTVVRHWLYDIGADKCTIGRS